MGKLIHNRDKLDTMFDLKKLMQHKKKNKNNINNSPFFQFICNDIIDRLEPIKNKFREILLINPPIKQLLIKVIKEKYPRHNLKIIDNPNELTDSNFDLIIFPMGLHWISDIQEFLFKLRKSLKNDGVLICNFPGGGSLKELRYKLIELEANNSTPHTPHISPFLQFEQITPLLQQAGFGENIIDMEAIELEYNSALDLMKSIQNIGESNALTGSSSYSITKKMHKELEKNPNNLFIDHINLITFISSPTKNTIKLKSEHFYG